MSLATDLGGTLLDLLRHRPPRVPRAKWQTNYVIGSISESPNKQAVSNACELVYQFDRVGYNTCKQILSWWEWKAGEPFMPKECLTPEEAYRGLTAYPDMVAVGVGVKLGTDHAVDGALTLARAHFAWCLLGLGPVPGRIVLDHHLEDIHRPCVLIGQGRAKHALRRVAQAGKRGWVRRDTAPKNFQFTDHVGLSTIVYQGLQWDIPRKTRNYCRWQTDILAAIVDRFPFVPVWGLDPSLRITARDFANNPTDKRNVEAILPWLKPTSLPVKFTRFEDASVIAALLAGDSSSTDSLMLDGAYANGEVQMTSADDGLRSSTVRQVAWEEDRAFACQAVSGGGPVMRIPKPLVPVAYSILSREGRTWVEGPIHGASTPLMEVPAQPADKPRGDGNFWKGIMWGDR
jgi:hypothetical protein